MRLWEDGLVVAMVLVESEEEELAIGIDVSKKSSDTMWKLTTNWYCAALPNTVKALCIYTLISCIVSDVHEEFEFKYTTTKCYLWAGLL